MFFRKSNNIKAGRVLELQNGHNERPELSSRIPSNIKGSSLVLLPILLPEKCVVTYFVT
jgi:hypothetical protein